MIEVARDAQGVIVENGTPHDESFMQIRMNEQRDPHRLDRIRRDLERVLADVRAAVTDWRAMRGKVEAALLELDKLPPPLPAEEIHEASEFLAWMGAD